MGSQGGSTSLAGHLRGIIRFLNMLKLMRKKALQLVVNSERAVVQSRR